MNEENQTPDYNQSEEPYTDPTTPDYSVDNAFQPVSAETAVKKKPAPWIWIVLAVAVVGIAALCFFLFAGNKSMPSYESQPAEYLSAATLNTSKGIQDNFKNTPFGKLTSGCEGITDPRILMDMNVSLPDEELSVKMEENVSLEKKAISIDFKMDAANEKMNMAMFMSPEKLLLSAEPNVWYGINLETLVEDLNNSPLSPDSDSFFSLDSVSAEQYISALQEMSSTLKNLSTDTVSASFDADKFMNTIYQALPKPQLEKAAYTFEETEKEYNAYHYHFTNKDIEKLILSVWDAMKADPVLSQTLSIYEAQGLTDPHNGDLDIPEDVAFDLIVAFHDNHVAAFSIIINEVKIEGLFGEDLSKPENAKLVIYADDDTSATISLKNEKAEGDNLAFTGLSFELNGISKEQNMELSLGYEWDPKGDTFNLSMDMKVQGMPIQVTIPGTLQSSGKGKGFTWNISEMEMSAMGMKQALPISITLSAEPGKGVTEPADWKNILTLSEDELIEFSSSVNSL